MLFQQRFAGLRSGAITMTVRRWKRPQVRAGGRYRVAGAGVLAVDSVETVALGAIGGDDVARSGFAGREQLLAALRGSGPLDDATPPFIA